jgi:hypothetical protein
MSQPRDPTLALAEKVAALLASQGVDCLVIGAVALAAHGYPRATEDVDLAIAIAPRSLQGLARALEQAGAAVEVRMPDADDPLGGVIDVRWPGAQLVQVINFDNSPAGGFPRLVARALPRSLVVGEGLRVADAGSLVAFKLYAGGRQSTMDILELLDRNAVDIAELRATCSDLGLGRELDAILDSRS